MRSSMNNPAQGACSNGEIITEVEPNEVTAHRVFFVWDFEEEEKWINEMAAKA